MKKRLFTLSLLVATTLATLGLTAGSADAQALRGWKAVVTVPPATTPDDLHMTFTGTGGSTAIVSITPAPSGSSVTGGNTINVDWNPTPGKLAPGTVVTVVFTTTTPNVAFNSGTWTNANVNIGSVSGVTVNQYALPGVSPLSLMLLALGIASIGMFALRQRRAEA